MTLESILEKLRQKRGFVHHLCLARKADLINDYFRTWSLDSAVVGVSGGVDSALVLAMFLHAREQPNSPLRDGRILALSLPVFVHSSTGQKDGCNRVDSLIAAMKSRYGDFDFQTADLTDATASMVNSIGLSSPWAQGQLVSIMRTPALYYAAARLQDDGYCYRSVVIGTTNRDEGGYIGFYGKASDGMVDIQPISDLHKSEVRDLATVLGVPSLIVDAPASGGVWDGRTDEEMIGCPYWFVELYTLTRDYPNEVRLDELTQEAGDLFDTYRVGIERLRTQNLHKYQVGSPAVHLDVYQRVVI